MTPDINFNKQAIESLPPDKRSYKFWKGWFLGITSQMKRLNEIFSKFRKGNTSDYYDNSNSYDLDEEVIYKYKVYKSLIDSNSGNLPTTNPSKWQKISDSFIGQEESSLFSSLRLNMEWQLNRQFKKELTDNGFIGFRQPDDPINPTPSDINIENIAPEFTSFIVFETEQNSSIVFEDGSNNSVVFEDENFTNESSYLFKINIPHTVFSNISANGEIAETIVRQFLDRCVPSGIFYTIQLY